MLFLGLTEPPSTESDDRLSYRQLLARAAPVVVLTGAATWLLQARSMRWPLVVADDPVTTQMYTLWWARGLVSPTRFDGLALLLTPLLVGAVGIGVALLRVRPLRQLCIRVDT